MEGGALSETSIGRVEGLWTKRSHRGMMDARTEATFVAGKGIDGNTCRSSTRQVTIIAREQWEAMIRELGAARIRIGGETRPCGRMDEAYDGLRAAMDGEWRGGVFGEVLDDGIVIVGDPVAWESPVED